MTQILPPVELFQKPSWVKMGTPSKKVSMLPSVENLLTSVNDPSTSGSNCYRALVSIREHISNSQFLSDFLSSDGIKV